MQFGIQLVLCVSWTMFTPGFYTTKISGMMPRKKKIIRLISQLLRYTCISPSSPAQLYKACCSLVPKGYNLYMGAEKNDGRFWTDLKSCAAG